MSRRSVPDAARVREVLDPVLGALVHPRWADDFPWLLQGTTTRGRAGEERDFGLFAADASSGGAVLERWSALLASCRMPSAVHARQLHEACVRFHSEAGSGLGIAEPCDGHATERPGVLLAVSVADCVPVFVVDPRARVVALLHAGWRGTAAGILERGLALLAARAGSEPKNVHAHLGPAICGACYEVGPEVFSALGLPAPGRSRALDLRDALFWRAVALGIDPAKITVSAHCTRCTGSDLFSHRGGDRGRQIAFLGMRL
jgi:YfiH family protein